MTDQAAQADDSFVDGDEFDLDSLFDEQARDWPYSAERNVVFSGVTVEAHDRFGNFYDDSDKVVKFNDAKSLDKDNLPVGYTFHPNVNLVLHMVVEDPSLPEPDYPPTVPLGDTRGVRIIDATHFQFVKADGTPRNPSANSTFKAWLRDLLALGGQVREQVNPKHGLVDGSKVWSTSVFNDLALVYGPKQVSINNNDPKTRAWPIALAGGETAAAAPTGDTQAQLAAAAEAANGDANAFRNAAINIKGLDSTTVSEIVKDPAAFLATISG